MRKEHRRGFFHGFRFAFRGLAELFRSERNAWVHLFAAVCAVALGVWLKIPKEEWIIVAFCIGFVFAAEIFNSAIEHLCDKISPEKNETVRRVKDMSAGAVLVAAITALIAGIIIFGPKLWEKFFS